MPALLFALAAGFSARSGFDLWLADRIADGSAGFALRRAPWALRLHDAGDWVVRGLAVALLLALLRARPLPRRTALYLLASLALTVGVAGLLKQTSAPVCPWDLGRYGGAVALPGGLAGRAGHCFPGGHSAGAFGLLAFAFVWRRRALLIAVLAAGFAFAALQWLRGAHFVSHDLCSAAIGWAAAALLQPLRGSGEVEARAGAAAGAVL